MALTSASYLIICVLFCIYMEDLSLGLPSTDSLIQTTSDQRSTINSTSLPLSSLKTSNATETQTTATAIITSTASQSISKWTLPITPAEKSSSLSQEGELTIIVVCVLVGTGIIIAAVAYLSCYLNKQKTLDYSSKKSFLNGSVKSGSKKDSIYEMQDSNNTTDSAPSTSHMSPRLSTEDQV